MDYTSQNKELLELGIKRDATKDTFDAVRQFPGADPAPKRKQRKYNAEELTLPEIQALLDKANKVPDTHAELAHDLVDEIARESGYPPVAADGRFYVCNRDTEIWEPLDLPDMSVRVTSPKFSGTNCKRGSDYEAVTKLLYKMCSAQKGHKDFFGDDNPYKGGIAVGDEFLRVTSTGQLLREPLAAYHRCRYPIPASHVSFDGPWRWMSFLYEVFAGEEAQAQIDLLQEIFGATLFGLSAEHHKAALFKGVTRAGKGVVSRMLEKLVPESAISAVSPYSWGCKRSTSRMAGRLLNLVGELEHNRRIDAGMFKSFLGGDRIESAELYTVGFFHRNIAMHVFSSNYFPPTTDHGDAFFERWAVLYFPHSVPEQDRIPDLEDEIAMDELPQILGWAIQGARRLLERGRYSLTGTHRRLVQEWGRRANLALSFLHDKEAVELVPGAKTPAAQFYNAFKHWCATVAQSKPPGRQEFYDLLDISGAVSRSRQSATTMVLGARLPGSQDTPFSETK